MGLLAAAIWSTIELRINIASLADSVANAQAFAQRVFPLDFPPLGELVSLTAQTLAIVTLATLLSVRESRPVAGFAAWNTTTGAVARGSARTLIVVCRAVPDLILAIVFFRIFGLGALPGVLALGLHSVGMVGKLYADAIESLDNGPQEAIRAAGGGRTQQIVSGIIPPLMPQLIATALHRFDINLRTSVVLGYVGVGGLGLAISDAMRTLDYPRGMALAVAVLILCVVVELVSGSIRTALMTGGRPTRGRGIAGLADRVSAGWVTGGPAASRPGAPGRERLVPPWDSARIARFAFVAGLLAIVVLSFAGSRILLGGSRLRPRHDALDAGAVRPAGRARHPAAAAARASRDDPDRAGRDPHRRRPGDPDRHPRRPQCRRESRVQTSFRVLIVVVRGIPELILAIIFVVVTGLGGVTGTLALAVGAIGLLSKLVADSLEETDVRVQEALRASGASGVQVFFAATLRQAAPAFVAHLMYLLDVNIRSATLLGIVRAGGIGFYLLNASRVMHFDVVTTIVQLILAVVLVVEGLAVFVRRAVS